MDLKESLKYLKLRESAISMILGALVIIISGILLVNYLSQRGTAPVEQISIGDETANLSTTTPGTHVVASNENLWSIAEKYYGDGYMWTEIAKANNLANADAISEGQTLTIPTITPSPIAQATLGVPTETTSPTTTQFPIATSTPFATITPSPVTTSVPTDMPTVIATSTPTPTVFTTDGQGAISTESRTHTVQAGDSLWKIAETYFQSGYNWSDIAGINRLTDPNNITVGQVLMIPNVQPKAGTVGTTAQDVAISGTTYTVQGGDTLWSIALRAYGDGFKWSEIARENNLKAPNNIHKGNILSLPR